MDMFSRDMKIETHSPQKQKGPHLTTESTMFQSYESNEVKVELGQYDGHYTNICGAVEPVVLPSNSVFTVKNPPTLAQNLVVTLTPTPGESNSGSRNSVLERKTYSCEQCSFTTAISSCFSRHKKRHEDNPYQCDQCSCGYASISTLTQHKRRVHEGAYNETKFDTCDEHCAVCSEIIQVHLMTSHRTTRHPEVKPYFCRFCHFETPYFKSLEDHKKTHDPATVSLLCHKCSRAFKSPAALSLHINHAHLTEPEKEIRSTLKNTSLEMETCTLCSKMIDKGCMNSHLMMYHPEAKDSSNLDTEVHTLCSKSSDVQCMTSQRLQYHPKGKTYYCKLCPYETSSFRALKKHKCRHTQKFLGEQCSSAFTTAVDRHRHTKLVNKKKIITELVVNNSVKKIIECSPILENCTVCSKSIPTTRMTSHRKIHHPEVRPYYCRECPYEASCRKSLTKHKNHHVIQNDFSCSYCCASFSRLSLANAHIRTVHPNSPELVILPDESNGVHKNYQFVAPVYLCVLCSRRFEWEINLRRHMGYHIMSYSCPHCETRFPLDAVLKQHLDGGHCKGQRQNKDTGQLHPK